jgi:anti-sigma factor RsiW
MSDLGPRLSAYLDRALSAAEMAEIEGKLASDAATRAELSELLAANEAAKADFAMMLTAPVPLSLARAVNSTLVPEPAAMARRPMPFWSTLAASIALVAVGAAGGYFARPADPARDWIAEIGEYHAVYATQTRHLAEVPASEAAHIKTWLAANVGVDLPIPDLTAQGLTFEGGRLLVAAGKPVGQLMYRDAAGAVIAICFTASDKPATDTATPRDLNGFDAQVWGVPGARVILIGPKGDSRLPEIASAALTI